MSKKGLVCKNAITLAYYRTELQAPSNGLLFSVNKQAVVPSYFGKKRRNHKKNKSGQGWVRHCKQISFLSIFSTA